MALKSGRLNEDIENILTEAGISAAEPKPCIPRSMSSIAAAMRIDL
jgi:hypothetical protein